MCIQRRQYPIFCFVAKTNKNPVPSATHIADFSRILHPFDANFNKYTKILLLK